MWFESIPFDCWLKVKVKQITSFNFSITHWPNDHLSLWCFALGYGNSCIDRHLLITADEQKIIGITHLIHSSAKRRWALWFHSLMRTALLHRTVRLRIDFVFVSFSSVSAVHLVICMRLIFTTLAVEKSHWVAILFPRKVESIQVATENMRDSNWYILLGQTKLANANTLKTNEFASALLLVLMLMFFLFCFLLLAYCSVTELCVTNAQYVPKIQRHVIMWSNGHEYKLKKKKRYTVHVYINTK